ncbi:MAG: SagB/ThcOx family dehydrogenase, partial [Halobacteria archaeon]|nr:SagB/ThcOx family dehydrogenase [Halobacteria archaeon]
CSSALEKDNRMGKRPPGDGERFDLEPVDDQRASKVPVYWTIKRRGSCREYERDTLSFRKFSTILDRSTRGFDADFRNENPGVQYNDLYIIANDIGEIPNGTYHYHPETNELELLKEGDFRVESGHLALDQQLGADAAVCCYFMSDVGEVCERLGNRGYRVAQLEASLMGGNMYLGAYAHSDLGATGLTFYDDKVTSFFKPRAEGQTPMFLVTMGKPA